MNDQPPQAVAPTAAGNVSLSTIVELLSENVEIKSDPQSLAPSRGRVAKDAEDDSIWLADGTSWRDVDHDVGVDLAALPGVTVVRSADDLPDADGGVRTLEGGQAYLFTDFIADPATLRLGSPATPLIGHHGSVSGYICTGGGPAVRSDGEPFMMRDFYLHAPGGQVFELTAPNTVEMLVESCSFSDAAGLGNIASLGQITGYRVPTFKGCNFEDFDGGLTFDGDPDKVFVWGSPLRKVTASNVTIFTLAGTASAQIVDFADNYVKDVQGDTEIWRVETGASPSEVFQYRGTTHDTSVITDNILNGEADAQTEPYWVSDSYPLRESSVVGELTLDAETSTTISSTGTWTDVAGTTTMGNDVERVSSPSDGTLQYDGSKDSNVHISLMTSFSGANGSVYQIAIAKNGTVEPASAMEIQAEGQNATKSLSTSAIEDLAPGDTISPLVRNDTDTNNATFVAYTINFLGM